MLGWWPRLWADVSVPVLQSFSFDSVGRRDARKDAWFHSSANLSIFGTGCHPMGTLRASDRMHQNLPMSLWLPGLRIRKFEGRDESEVSDLWKEVFGYPDARNRPS